MRSGRPPTAEPVATQRRLSERKETACPIGTEPRLGDLTPTQRDRSTLQSDRRGHGADEARGIRCGDVPVRPPVQPRHVAADERATTPSTSTETRQTPAVPSMK